MGEMTQPPPQAPGDSELATRAAEGDAAAFALIVERYSGLLWRIASHRFRDAGVVEDVVQETFLRAWRGLRSFRGDCSLRTWFTRICINCCIDEWHRQQSARTLPFDDLRDLLTTEDVIGDLVTNIDIRTALLAHLPADERDAFVLIHVLGLSAVAAATARRAPPTTMRSREQRARHRMRTQLGDRATPDRVPQVRAEDTAAPAARPRGTAAAPADAAATAGPRRAPSVPTSRRPEEMSWDMEP
jgi:RNA polymerase sigma-70 factor, ECF subfamily